LKRNIFDSQMCRAEPRCPNRDRAVARAYCVSLSIDRLLAMLSNAAPIWSPLDRVIVFV